MDKIVDIHSIQMGLTNRTQSSLDIKIITDIIAKNIVMTPKNIIIISDTSGLYPVMDLFIQIVYLDVTTISWSILNRIMQCYPKAQVLILKADHVIGNAIHFYDMLDHNRELQMLLVIINGEETDRYSTTFFRDWNNNIPGEGFHIYYQNFPYRPSVLSLVQTGSLNKLSVINAYDKGHSDTLISYADLSDDEKMGIVKDMMDEWHMTSKSYS